MSSLAQFTFGLLLLTASALPAGEFQKTSPEQVRISGQSDCSADKRYDSGKTLIRGKSYPRQAIAIESDKMMGRPHSFYASSLLQSGVNQFSVCFGFVHDWSDCFA
jgi:hypothetical protein